MLMDVLRFIFFKAIVCECIINLLIWKFIVSLLELSIHFVTLIHFMYHNMDLVLLMKYIMSLKRNSSLYHEHFDTEATSNHHSRYSTVFFFRDIDQIFWPPRFCLFLPPCQMISAEHRRTSGNKRTRHHITKKNFLFCFFGLGSSYICYVSR